MDVCFAPIATEGSDFLGRISRPCRAPGPDAERGHENRRFEWGSATKQWLIFGPPIFGAREIKNRSARSSQKFVGQPLDFLTTLGWPKMDAFFARITTEVSDFLGRISRPSRAPGPDVETGHENRRFEWGSATKKWLILGPPIFGARGFKNRSARRGEKFVGQPLDFLTTFGWPTVDVFLRDSPLGTLVFGAHFAPIPSSWPRRRNGPRKSQI